jgi:hypothetical protein
MLCPSLFIGIGSTGLDILERLQELVLEHYGRPALDTFRYIAIETREAAEVKHPEWGESEIQLIRPVVRNTDAIHAAVRAGEKAYLRDWLDPDLLRIPGRQFVDGASNIRMAGRLIFWENWETIRIALSKAFNQITSDQNKTSTREFLAAHYRKTGQPFGDRAALVSNLPSVYVVGTLCGGTCSGMFVDIGYCIKEITGLWSERLPNPNIAKIIGVLTMFDAATLSSASQQAVQGLAANCWAALKEYDFWCHPETRYQVVFPTRLYPERKYDVDTNERPIDWLYALSCSATDSRNVVTSNLRRGGQPDLESLQHMAAVVLFTETIGGLLAEKDRIRTDYRGRDRALRRNAAQHSPCLATCGVASIWYPRYRVAEGAACTYAAGTCESWLGSTEPNERQLIEKQSASDWRRIIKQRLGEIASSSTGTLVSDAEHELDGARERVLAMPSEEFVQHLKGLIGQLGKGGKYDRHLSDRDRWDRFLAGIRQDISQAVKETVSKSGDLAAAEYYVSQIDQAIRRTLEAMPAEYPSPETAWVTARAPDVFARLLFRGRVAERRLREESIAQCRAYMSDQIKHIRNHRIRPLLVQLSEFLGVGESAQPAGADGGISTLRQQLDAVRSALSACAEELRKKREQLSAAVPHTQDVAVVSEDSSSSIGADIDRLVAQFEQSLTPERREDILRRIMGDRRLGAFLDFERKDRSPADLRHHLCDVLVRIFLEQSRSFDIVDHVLASRSPAELADFARHALPHLELTPGSSNLASSVIGRPVSLIVGRSAEAADRARQALVGTSCEGLFELAVGSAELSHMLIFCREEPLMYMDENLATADLYEGCYLAAERSATYGLHSHKAGRIVYDPRIFERRKRTKEELMPIALKLMSARDTDGNWVSSDVFQLERGRLVRRDVRRSGLKFRLSADDDGVELCAQEAEIYEYLLAMVSTLLTRLTRDELVQRINGYLDWCERRAEALGEDPAGARDAEEQALLVVPMIRDRLQEAVVE